MRPSSAWRSGAYGNESGVEGNLPPTSADGPPPLTPQRRTASTDAERATLQNAIIATDWQVGALVYGLYGWDQRDIKLVAGGAHEVGSSVPSGGATLSAVNTRQHWQFAHPP